MSLLTDAYEELTIINKITVPDGYGGIETQYSDGATIEGALVFNSSGAVRIAEALGATGLYTLTVRKEIGLDFHTIFRRESDKTIFRVTSESDDQKTPPSASLNMRQYTVERWSLDA